MSNETTKHVKQRPTVCIDLDATLLHHGGYASGVFGERMPGALDAVRQLSEMGCELVVLTARGPSEFAGIQRHLNTHFPGIPIAHITNVKVPAMVYIDDRAIHFDGDWPAVVEEVKRRLNPTPLSEQEEKAAPCARCELWDWLDGLPNGGVDRTSPTEVAAWSIVSGLLVVCPGATSGEAIANLREKMEGQTTCQT